MLDILPHPILPSVYCQIVLLQLYFQFSHFTRRSHVYHFILSHSTEEKKTSTEYCMLHVILTLYFILLILFYTYIYTNILHLFD